MFATTSTRAEKRIFPRNNKCEPCMHVLVAETRQGKGGRDGARKLRLSRTSGAIALRSMGFIFLLKFLKGGRRKDSKQRIGKEGPW